MNNMDQRILDELKEIKHLLISRRKIAIALTVILALILLCLVIIRPAYMQRLEITGKETVEQR